MPDHFVYQEFYCNDCHGYFTANLNVSINHWVALRCPGPGCVRKHPRKIHNGRITSDGGGSGPASAEEILIPKSAYSKNPRTPQMRKEVVKNIKLYGKGMRRYGYEVGPKERGGVVIKNAELAGRHFLQESWFEKHGGA